MRDADPTTARALMNQGYTYLDVRTPEEFDQGHPHGAWNIPAFFRGPGGMEPNPRFLDVVKANFRPGEKLLIGCASGGRSAKACAMLAAEGYADCFNVAGGFGAWTAAGLPSSRDSEGRSFADAAARERSPR